MYKVIFLIDGFNLYHSIINPKFPQLIGLKWLNLRLLCNKFIRAKEELNGIYYFTSICTWNSSKAAKHKQYIKVLEDLGVQIVYGKFKEVNKRCRAACKQEFTTHEEKRTDVSIAIKLLSLAVQNKFDIAYIVSADSDLVPAIEEVLSLYPEKKIIPIFPFGKSSLEIKDLCKQATKIKEFHLIQSQLPEKVTLVDGTIIKCPSDWKASTESSSNANNFSI